MSLRAAYIAAVQAQAGAGYLIEPGPGGRLRAPNAAQGFAAEMDAGGVRIAAERFEVSLALAGYGCAGALAAPAPAAPEASGNRVDYRRGELTEWYLSGPLGLEQGFTLQEAPACRQAGGGEVTLELAVDGDLRPALLTGGQAVALVDASGRRALRYSELHVRDAAGIALPARLEVREGRVQIHVADDGAVYPVVVDPMIEVPQIPLPDSETAASLGFGLVTAISGDTAMVGAPFDELGAVHVFVRQGGGWTWKQKLPNDVDRDRFKRFGCAIALDGDTALIGSDQEDDEADDGGAAYVYARVGGSWTRQQRLRPSIPESYALFGHSLALSGDIALVAAPFDDGDEASIYADQGAVHVFERQGTTWMQREKLIQGESGDRAGYAVAIDGATALVGAPGHAGDDGRDYDGSAYIFVRGDDGAWTRQHTFHGVRNRQGHFGDAVALRGDTAVIGAGYYQGETYIFVRDENGWTTDLERASLSSKLESSLQIHDGFGRAVALGEDIALVGAPFVEHPTGVHDSGAAYVFARQHDAEWQLVTHFIGAPEPSTVFGRSVALDGTTALIGAVNDYNGRTEPGSAYVYEMKGYPCGSALECLPGLFCVDGVCCDSECGEGAQGDCQACSRAAGAVADGTCSLRPAGAECRAASHACDVAETCEGWSVECPEDQRAPAGTVCRGATDACDMAELCDRARQCPDDRSMPDGAACTGGTCEAGRCSSVAEGGGASSSASGGDGNTSPEGCGCRAAGAPSGGGAPWSRLAALGLFLLGIRQRKARR
ncbi:hypothetical protein [Sorangium sp. So ce1151]|uniref:hypothetical protein n=1 Tax=Sorangium sp. So ce1151 TaxID=3133332 RepID=UPI003F5ED1FB